MLFAFILRRLVTHALAALAGALLHATWHLLVAWIKHLI